MPTRDARPPRAVLAGVLFMMLLAAAPPQSAHDIRGEALRLYKAGQYQAALPLLNQVIERKPRDIDARNKRGNVYLRMNRPDLALDDFNASCRYLPVPDLLAQQLNRQFAPDVPYPLTAQPYVSYQLFPQTFHDRGLAYLMLGQLDKAIADFQHAITLYNTVGGGGFPGNRWAGLDSAYCGLGQALHRKHEDIASYDAFEQAIRLNPKGPNGYVGAGIALESLGRQNEALGRFADALRLAPNHSRAIGYRGATLEHLGRNDEALADFTTALRLDPTAAIFYRYRGALSSKLGHNDDALRDLNEAIRLNPNDADAYKDRGGVFERRHDSAHALADLNEALRLNPTSSRAFQNRAAAYNSRNQFDKALLDGDQAVKLDPRNAGARTNRGLSLLGLGRHEEAVEELTAAIQLDPNLPAAFVNRGSAYTRLALFDRAKDDYSEALRMAPGLAQAEVGLAQVRDLVREHARSTPLELDLSDHSDPLAAARHRDAGDALRATGDFTGAVAAYDRALAADPADAEAYSLRGWSRLAAGLPGAETDAREWLDRKGWRDAFAPYMALLGVLAARQPGQPATVSDDFLTEALANSRPPKWPAPVFRYLKRTLPSSDLFNAADEAGRRDEAEMIVGLDLLYRGERSAALDHLRAAAADTAPSISRDLARATLQRLNAAPAPAPRN
jgi:tetratricopeptide (TPR) repeat protein